VSATGRGRRATTENAVDDASCSADCTVAEPGRLVLAVVGVLVLLGARRASRVVAAGG
jgi:hypothetical protein